MDCTYKINMILFVQRGQHDCRERFHDLLRRRMENWSGRGRLGGRLLFPAMIPRTQPKSVEERFVPQTTKWR